MTSQAAINSIPICEPLLAGNEEAYLLDAFRSGWISSHGTYLKRFEESFAEFVGVKHAIAVTNGTAAIHLALVAAGIGAGDEVIVPDFTMIACAAAVAQTGATPVLVDADLITWTLDIARLEERITSKTKAIMAVHIYGHPVDMDPLRALAAKHQLLVLEDAAEAHGARYKDRLCGSLSDLACFSFYANKIITTGEGGMVVTNSDVLADKCRSYKNLCFPLTGGRRYWHEDVGFNYRMTNLQAAIGLAQLEKIDYYVDQRRANAVLYNSRLKSNPFLQLPAEMSWAKNCYWMYGVVLKPEAPISREVLLKHLADGGIDTRLFFEPMHRQPGLAKHLNTNRSTAYPVSDFLSRQGFYLPSGSGLTEPQVHRVCDVLLQCLS